MKIYAVIYENPDGVAIVQKHFSTIELAWEYISIEFAEPQEKEKTYIRTVTVVTSNDQFN